MKSFAVFSFHGFVLLHHEFAIDMEAEGYVVCNDFTMHDSNKKQFNFMNNNFHFPVLIVGATNHLILFHFHLNFV